MASIGSNPYFILLPGYRLVLKGTEEGKRVVVIITVLHQTKMINGVKTRVVQEKEFQNGRIVEISRNFFAISKTNNSVFYFGEEVDIFNKKGQIISHEGSWIAGKKGAKPGLIMPGLPLIGARYFQEQAPRVALDQSKILNVTATLQIPSGRFRNVLKIRETTPLEPGVVDFKFYARGIGLIKDGPVSFVRRSFKKSNKRMKTHLPVCCTNCRIFKK